MNACPDSTRPATITFRHAHYHAGRDLVITVIGGLWHWRIDEPNARNSRGYPTPPAAKAAARAALGLPAIGESGQHITAASIQPAS